MPNTAQKSASPLTSETPTLSIEKITLTNFRNYTSASLHIDTGPVVLFGENGSGKTNLLEALSLLAPGRGMRRAPFADIAREGALGDWAVSVRVNGPMGQSDIGTGQDPLSPGPVQGDGQIVRSRKLRINGNTEKSTKLLGDYARVIWLTPAMDRLFQGSSGERRRFLDRIVLASDPSHGTRVNAFESAMRERNKLLERRSGDESWLTSLETQMAEHAVAISAARTQTVGQIAGLMEHAQEPELEAAFPRAHIAIEGLIEDGLKCHSALEVEEQYRKILCDSRMADAHAGRALNGPHKSDLHVVHMQKNMPAHKCSTGEQKALLIGIVLAHARIIQMGFSGYAPLILLDEIVAHLDETRRQALFDQIESLSAQAWMTGTDGDLFDALQNVQKICVNDGTLSKA